MTSSSVSIHTRGLGLGSAFGLRNMFVGEYDESATALPNVNTEYTQIAVPCKVYNIYGTDSSAKAIISRAISFYNNTSNSYVP
jgi:hypothetical protein